MRVDKCWTNLWECTMPGDRRQPNSENFFMNRVWRGLSGGEKGTGPLSSKVLSPFRRRCLQFEQLGQAGGDDLRAGDVLAGVGPGPHLLFGLAEQAGLQVGK